MSLCYVGYTGSKMKKAIARRLIIASGSFTALFVFLATTDPFKLSLVVLFVPFVLLGVGVYHVVFLLSTLSGLSDRRGRAIAFVATGMLLLAALLQSIRQLSLRDFCILTILLAGVLFYMRRIDV